MGMISSFSIMSKSFKLTSFQAKELKRRKKEEGSAKIYRRLLFLDLKQKNKKHSEIAMLLDVCIDTLTDWLNIFESGGLKALCSLQYEGRRMSKLEPFKEEIRASIEKGQIKTLKHLEDLLQQKHSVSMKKSGLSKFLKKNSIVPTKKHA